MNERQPWHRRETETARAFHAFTLYRDMPPRERSLQRVMRAWGKSGAYIGVLERWSSRHQWVARALEHDEHVAEAKREARQRAAEEMAERQAREAMALQRVGLSQFVDEQGQLRLDLVLRVRDAIMAIVEGAKLERQARGEPEAPSVQVLADMRTQNLIVTSELLKDLRDTFAFLKTLEDK